MRTVVGHNVIGRDESDGTGDVNLGALGDFTYDAVPEINPKERAIGPEAFTLDDQDGAPIDRASRGRCGRDLECVVDGEAATVEVKQRSIVSC